MNDTIGYCGLDCKKCDAYIATISDDRALREKTAKLWAELNNAPILPEHINCEGCRADGAKTVFCENMCEIRKCAMKRTWLLAANVRNWRRVQLLGRLSQIIRPLWRI